MISQKIFSRYSNTSQQSLHELSFQLYVEQQKQWQMLADGVSALKNVQLRTIDCGDYSVRLQYNPKRIVSTGAKVDTASIKERKCFLCVENLPAEQQGVLYKENFLVLCNPMPIFKEHFTISHIAHIPQSLEETILSFLSLAKDLSPRYSVFYNGPKCGASAPDHMHFQASPFGFIPAEHEIRERKQKVKSVSGVTVFTVEKYGRNVIILEGRIEQELELTFLRMTSAMRKVMTTDEEPMMNVIASFKNDEWSLIIFPRAKHRPNVYFIEGTDKILISPASVDIGGLIVTPMEKDFQSVDAVIVKNIFEEVSVSQQTVQAIIENI